MSSILEAFMAATQPTNKFDVCTILFISMFITQTLYLCFVIRTCARTRITKTMAKAIAPYLAMIALYLATAKYSTIVTDWRAIATALVATLLTALFSVEHVCQLLKLEFPEEE